MKRLGQLFSAMKDNKWLLKVNQKNVNQPANQPTTLLTYLNGSNAAAVTAMSARVIHSPTKYVLGSRALSRTFRTRIKSARELCWAWGNIRGHMRSHTSKDKIFCQVPWTLGLLFCPLPSLQSTGKPQHRTQGWVHCRQNLATAKLDFAVLCLRQLSSLVELGTRTQHLLHWGQRRHPHSHWATVQAWSGNSEMQEAPQSESWGVMRNKTLQL